MTREHPLGSHHISRHRIPEAFRWFAPWTLILIITGLFQIFRGAPVDGAVFLASAALLIADAAGFVRFMRFTRFQPRRIFIISAAIVTGILLVVMPRHGIVDGLILVAVGLTILPLVWPDRDRPDRNSPGQGGPGQNPPSERRPQPHTHSAHSTAMRRAAILWASLGVFGCLWEVASFLLGLPSAAEIYEHPAVSDLLDPMLHTLIGRAVFVAVWILIGVGLLRRGGLK